MTCNNSITGKEDINFRKSTKRPFYKPPADLIRRTRIAFKANCFYPVQSNHLSARSSKRKYLTTKLLKRVSFIHSSVFPRNETTENKTAMTYKQWPGSKA